MSGLPIILVLLAILIHNSCENNQFYPNGRYGKRSSSSKPGNGFRGNQIPVASDEILFNEFNIKLLCSHTGADLYYKCVHTNRRREI
ncbi:unnamed protein product [Oppiella nova]|uniref:Uncharacterized protein n=1 Tax=Oppiella nova TaxID=334625 RepID=A0A7R9M6P8_9ACAR|nr:unnamed protein product [Oppiella nova]CAG2171796.1 unnamed protein product [Oppiella nova]